MFNLNKLFTKNSNDQNIQGDQKPSADKQPNVKIVKNWYNEKYDQLIVQRNILFILLTLFLILSVVSVIAVTIIISNKEFDPFVIQIDENTGVAKVVNPVMAKELDANESLARYFIKRYIIARETYNPVDFDTEARKIIRLFSASSVYWNYLGYIKNKDTDPTIVYAQKNTTFLIVKSWSKLADKKYMVRFSVNETGGQKLTFSKISVVDFDYVPLELTDEERDINPVGFQVKGYRVDDDNS